MRSGKSYISKLIIDKYSSTKALVIVGYRKIILQFESYFPNNYTFILSGKPFDHTQRVHLATFQTYNNRNISVAEYDVVIIDEYHSRQSKAVNDLIREAKSNGTTIVLLTGSPLTNKNKIITKHIDKFIQPISVLQMREQGYIAPTRFFSVQDVISDNKDTLKTNHNDYTEKAVTEVISKSNLLNSIVEQVSKNKLDTEHNTLIYVNFISVATKLFNLLSDFNNVNIIHSKMSNKEQEEALNKYHSDYGICISVRSLSLGFDSPKSDRLIFGLLTQIHSLALQVMWRASTLDPNNPNKVAIVYDMTGQLTQVNPYTDFSEYSKQKPSCIDEAMLIKDEEERMYAIMACKALPPVTICSNGLPSSLKDNPYVIDCTTTTPNIKPCKSVIPVQEMLYDTTEDKNNKGIIYKWSKCPYCGYVTKVVLKCMSTPNDLIEVHTNEPLASTNKVIAIYSKEYNKCLLVIDDPKLVSYKYVFATSQDDIFKQCKAILNNRKFSLSSNINLPKLTNAHLNESFDNIVPLVDWDDETKNTGLMRKLCKNRLDSLNLQFGYKKGLTYHVNKHITNKNLKYCVQTLGKKLSRDQYTAFRKKIEDEYVRNNRPEPVVSMPMPSLDLDIDDLDIPF